MSSQILLIPINNKANFKFDWVENGAMDFKRGGADDNSEQFSWPQELDFSLRSNIFVWHQKQKLKLLIQNTRHISRMLVETFQVGNLKGLWRSLRIIKG